jgi:hypothetical protein
MLDRDIQLVARYDSFDTRFKTISHGLDAAGGIVAFSVVFLELLEI